MDMSDERDDVAFLTGSNSSKYEGRGGYHTFEGENNHFLLISHQSKVDYNKIFKRKLLLRLILVMIIDKTRLKYRKGFGLGICGKL